MSNQPDNEQLNTNTDTHTHTHELCTPDRIKNFGIKYQTDKVLHHEYNQYYDPILSKFYHTENPGAMLEIGMLAGCSLKMWLDVFPRAFIYGLDINIEDRGERYRIFKADQSCPEQLQAVANEIIQTKQHKQQMTLNPSDSNVSPSTLGASDINKTCSTPLFFINDDGSHIPEHQLLTFNTLFPLLQEGGVYIIEDIETSYWTRGEIYGYECKYGYQHPKSIVEIFKNTVDIINREFSTFGRANASRSTSGVNTDPTHAIKHHDSIDQVIFARNCIIITKKTSMTRPYRFRNLL